MDTSIDAQSDCSVEGFDPSREKWVIANRTKRNKKENKKVETPCNNSENEKELLDPSRCTASDAGSMCGSCQMRANSKDRVIECEVCLLWYHIECQKVPVKLYEALTDGGDSCAWYCQACKEGVKQLRLHIIAIQREQQSIKMSLDKVVSQATQNSSEIAAMKAKQAETNQNLERYHCGIQSRLDSIDLRSANIAETGNNIPVSQLKLEKRLAQLEQRCGSTAPGSNAPADYAQAAASMAALENRLDELSVSVKLTEARNNTADTRALKRGLTELEDIENRKFNLMVFNLPETGSSAGDIESFKELIKSEFNLSVKLQGVTRLGKNSDDSPRMLRVTLEAVSEKKLILARAKDLRTSKHEIYARVFIRPDLTKIQLEVSKNLRALLKEKRAASPNKNWMIKRNAVVEVQT